MKNNRFYGLLAVLLMASAPLLGGTVSVERAKALGAKFVEANFKNNTELKWVYTADHGRFRHRFGLRPDKPDSRLFRNGPIRRKQHSIWLGLFP